MPIHVSIHDVSPAWEKEVDAALALCSEVGAKPALLVVPDFHGEWPLLNFPEYQARLRDLQSQGHEVYLHGYSHRARPKPTKEEAVGGRRAGLRWDFAQRVVSAGEAEFSDLTQAEVRERLADGDRILRDSGLVPTGFVPPAWSMPPWVRNVLGEFGYEYTEDHLRIYDPKRGVSRISVVLNFASRTRSRMLSSVAWCRIAQLGTGVCPTRIALHPADMKSPFLIKEAKRLLQLGNGEKFCRGKDLFD